MEANRGEATQLLERIRSSDADQRREARHQLVTLLYGELRRRAHALMRSEKAWTELQPTALVHEAYERLVGCHMRFEDSGHFLNVGATVMRRILVDRARARVRLKRGGKALKQPLDDFTALQATELNPDALLDLNAALSNLKPDQIKLVELRYFMGLSFEETAAIMGINVETLKKRWRVVRLLLYEALTTPNRTRPVSTDPKIP